MKGGEFVSFVEKGGLVTVVLWVSGLMTVFSVLSIPELESSIKLLVLLNIVNIFFIMILSMQVLVVSKK